MSSGILGMIGGVSIAPSGIAAGLGLFLFIDSMTTAGLGAAYMITGLLSDDNSNVLKESAPTGLFNILAQSADSIMNNENHCVERITNDLTLLHGAASGAVKVLYKGHYLEGGTSTMGVALVKVDTEG